MEEVRVTRVKEAKEGENFKTMAKHVCVCLTSSRLPQAHGSERVRRYMGLWGEWGMTA